MSVNDSKQIRFVPRMNKSQLFKFDDSENKAYCHSRLK